MTSTRVRILGGAKFFGGIFALSVLMGPTALAGTITFNDLGSSLSFTDTTGRASGSCTMGAGINGPGSDGVCVVKLTGPSGSPSWTANGNIYDAVGSVVSDTLLINPTNDPQTFAVQYFTITYTSGSGLTPLQGTNSIREDGTVQTGAQIFWQSVATDTIQFQSNDVQGPAMPEPSAWILFSSGIALVALSRRMKGGCR